MSASLTQRYARLSGALYLAIILLGVSGEAWIRGSLIVYGDAAATAANLLAHELLWRTGIAAQCVLLLCATAMTWTWYQLFRAVSAPLARLATLFGVVSLALESIAVGHLQSALVPLTSTGAGGMADVQRQATAYLAIVQHANTFGLALLFFGVQCVLIAHLIHRSGYLSRAASWLMLIAGCCYVVNSLIRIVHPSFASMLFPWILLPCLVGEAVFCLNLLTLRLVATPPSARFTA